MGKELQHEERTPAPPLKGGVLIIGSLWWDPKRDDWRTACLERARRLYVKAPIRYGKISKSRSCTYTMVFSNEYDVEEKRGQALYVPFFNNPVTIDALLKQAIELIKAERNQKDLENENFFWGWGALGICFNDSVKQEVKAAFQEEWKKKFNEGIKAEKYKAGQEKSIIDQNGNLLIEWPKELNDYDFLIATAIKPAENEYPANYKIVERMRVNEYTEYFDKNREHKIETSDDEEILKAFTRYDDQQKLFKNQN